MTEQERAVLVWEAKEEMARMDSLEAMIYGEDDAEGFCRQVRLETALIAGVTALIVAMLWRRR